MLSASAAPAPSWLRRLRCASVVHVPFVHSSARAGPSQVDSPTHWMCAVQLATQAGAPQGHHIHHPGRVLSGVPRGASPPSRSRVRRRGLSPDAFGAIYMMCIAMRNAARRTVRPHPVPHSPKGRRLCVLVRVRPIAGCRHVLASPDGTPRVRS